MSDNKNLQRNAAMPSDAAGNIEQADKKAQKVKVLVDVWIECEAPYWVGKFCRNQENRAREFESWAKEFEQFVRDHRSQDPVSLYVQRKYEERCSECDCEWETDIDERGEYCLGCGRLVE